MHNAWCLHWSATLVVLRLHCAQKWAMRLDCAQWAMLGWQNPMGRKLLDASVAEDNSAGPGTNSAPAGYNTGAGTTSGRKLQDAVVGTGNGGSAVSVRHGWAFAPA